MLLPDIWDGKPHSALLDDLVCDLELYSKSLGPTVAEWKEYQMSGISKHTAVAEIRGFLKAFRSPGLQ